MLQAVGFDVILPVINLTWSFLRFLSFFVEKNRTWLKIKSSSKIELNSKLIWKEKKWMKVRISSFSKVDF